MFKQIRCFFCVWAFFCSFQGNAQHTLTGTVKDAETGLLLDGANVLVLRGERTVSFTISNENGAFSIPLNVSPDTLTLSVSMMGYTAFSEKMGNRTTFQVMLTPSPIQLKEVTIRPGRIWGRSDTVRYDASKFLRENDQTVEDLMKRLPGIQVDDDGKIQYKGKEIGTMYVEGLDLMDSRYKSVSRNIPAQSVKEVEVLDNHQRIKSLAGKVPSDIADINIKLKDNFKDKWKFNPEAAAGFSTDDLLYEVDANALQIARKSQSLYALKLSDTGNGITKEADKGIDDLLALPDYRLLQPDAVSAPLKERRWLFNDAAIATGNRLYRIGDDSRMKFNAFYSHDNIEQETSSVTSYFNPEDTLTIEENKNRHLQGRKFNLSADYEDNASSHYVRNKLDFNIDNQFARTGITGSYDVAERQKNETVTIQDNFSITRTLADQSIFHLKSLLGYWRHSQELEFADYRQPLLQEGFYARAEPNWIISKTNVSQQYNMGASIDLNSLMNHYRVWVTPSYEYLYRSMKFNLGIPLQAVILSGNGGVAGNGGNHDNGEFSSNGNTSGNGVISSNGVISNNEKMLFLPGVNFRADYKLNYAWSARLWARYGKEFTDVTAFYRSPYFTDYRTIIENETGVPVTGRQSYTLRTEYKNTLKEFFVTVDLTASASRLNHTLEQTAENDLFRWTRRYVPHRESSYGFNTVVSKGFYDINTNMSFETSWRYNRSAQLRDNILLPFSFQNLLLKPTFSISPTSHTEISYNGELQRLMSKFGENAPSNALWNMSHKASFYYMLRRFDFSLSGEYFRNEIASDHAVHLFFTDLTASIKFDRLTLQCQLNNLLNHRDYSYTVYNPLSVYSSRIGIRPREFLVRVKVRL